MARWRARRSLSKVASKLTRLWINDAVPADVIEEMVLRGRNVVAAIVGRTRGPGDDDHERLRPRAARVEVHGVVYGGDRPSDIVRLDPQARTVNSSEGINVELRRILKHDAYEATFDVSSLPVWTGRATTLAVISRGVAISVGTLTFPAEQKSWLRSVWVQLAAGVLIVGLPALLLKIRAQRLL